MFGIPLRYLVSHPGESLHDLAQDPFEVWTTIRERYIAYREGKRPQFPYLAIPNWEVRLHADLNLPWPCDFVAEFYQLWPQVIRELESLGIKVGPRTFLNWNDGDTAFVRALWCLTRHCKPETIVETGVGHGVTSRFLLEALERNGAGKLFSIDLPPIERHWRSQIGIAVGKRFPARWMLIKGSSRRQLPHLLARLGQLDLFIHDSLHSEHNVRFEMDLAWSMLRPGGAMAVDDIDANWGFQSFLDTFAIRRSLVCDAEPLRPDERRFNQRGLFGIILQPTATRALSKTAGV